MNLARASTSLSRFNIKTGPGALKGRAGAGRRLVTYDVFRKPRQSPGQNATLCADITGEKGSGAFLLKSGAVTPSCF